MPIDQYTLYICTSEKPQHLITKMLGAIEQHVPLTSSIWKTVTSDVKMYECELPQKDDRSIKGTLRVDACYLPGFATEHMSDLFVLGDMETCKQDYLMVEFTIDDCGEYWEIYSQMLRALGGILRSVSGDCFWETSLSYLPLLIRRDGQVIADPAITTWSEEDKQTLGVPITTEKLRYLDMPPAF